MFNLISLNLKHDMNIPAYLTARIDEVIGYVGDTTTDYLLVKRQLINTFPTSSRSLFSARHHSTKKHILNDFDRAVMGYWLEQTGRQLEIEPGKLHNPEWEQKKKGWALKLLNEERKQQRNENKRQVQQPA